MTEDVTSCEISLACSRLKIGRRMQVIIYVVLCLFAFTVYATNKTLGSPAQVSDPLPQIMIVLGR